MTYALLIKRQAKKMLKSLSRPDRNRVTEKIIRLGVNPDDAALDIKKLQALTLYRLRVGQWRIIFSREDAVKIILIQKIHSRGGAYHALTNH